MYVSDGCIISKERISYVAVGRAFIEMYFSTSMVETEDSFKRNCWDWVVSVNSSEIGACDELVEEANEVNISYSGTSVGIQMHIVS